MSTTAPTTGTDRNTPAPEAPQTGRISTARAWTLVAQREVSVKLRDKAFIFGTLLSLAVMVAAFAFQAWNAERDRSYDVAVTSSASSLAGSLEERVPSVDDKVSFVPVEVADEDAARAALADESADAWLHQDGDQWVLTGQSEVDGTLTGAVEPALQQIALADNAEQQGVDLAALQQGTTLTTSQIEGSSDQAVAATVVGIIMAALFYVSAVLFGSTLAMSVVEEKQSRVVEIIATSIPVRQLLVGKLVGNITLAMLQLALYIAVALVGVSFTDFGGMLPNLTSGLVWFVAFFLVGFTLVATLFAVAGALASRTEDVQSTSVPVTMLVLAMFAASFLASGQIADVLAYLPPFSGIIMPMRVVSGEATWWQALVALVLLAAAAAVVLALAERIYRRALLQTSGKLGYREAWNAEI